MLPGKFLNVHSRPLERWHDNYQIYYHTGLRAVCPSYEIKINLIKTGKFPNLLRMIKNLKSTRLASIINPIANAIGSTIEGRDKSFSGKFDSLVGEYELHFEDSKVIKFCIDASDSGAIRSNDLLNWSDFYFKTNYLLSTEYPKKVIPIINGSKPCCENLKFLRQLRKKQKKYDFTAIFRVWGGTNNIEGIEHNIRILEELNKIKSKNSLIIAILAAGDRRSLRKRLETQGIKVEDKLLPIKKIWELGAESKFSIQRLGVHYCMHWRFIDSIASGASIILDTHPKSIWPEPLKQGLHFESFGLNVGINSPLASDDDYKELPSKMQAFLSKPNLSNFLGTESQKYFDNHAAPNKVGEYIIKKLLD